jgi:hypothetical protein
MIIVKALLLSGKSGTDKRDGEKISERYLIACPMFSALKNIHAIITMNRVIIVSKKTTTE